LIKPLTLQNIIYSIIKVSFLKDFSLMMISKQKMRKKKLRS